MNKLALLLLLSAPVFAQSSGLPSRVTGTVGNCVKIGTNNIATDNGAVCGTGTGTSVSQNSGSAETSLAVTGFMPQVCSDTSASGTAQTCTVANSFTPQAGNCIVYKTTTANSGTGLTVNVDSLGAKSVAVPGASGWTTTLVASSSIPANKPMNLCYDGTNWNASGTGFAASGSGALTLISSQTLGSAAATITFSSIPGTYTNLRLACTARGSQSAADTVTVQFNADTGAHYDQTSLFISGTGTPSGSPSVAQTQAQIGSVTGSSAPAGNAASWNVTLYNYAGTTFNKNYTFDSFRNDTNLTSGMLLQLIGADWRSTAAITSFTMSLQTGGNTFITGSTCSLYGMQ